MIWDPLTGDEGEKGAVRTSKDHRILLALSTAV